MQVKDQVLSHVREFLPGGPAILCSHPFAHGTTAPECSLFTLFKLLKIYSAHPFCTEIIQVLDIE